MKHYTNRIQKVKQQFFFKPNFLYFVLHELKKNKQLTRVRKRKLPLTTPEDSRNTPSRHQPQGSPALTSKR